MAAVMIGVDPHKASHTAVAISAAEEPLGELRVRACVAQAERLLAWAAAWPERTWAVEGAAGLRALGHARPGRGMRRSRPHHPEG
jgi:transposase